MVAGNFPELSAQGEAHRGRTNGDAGTAQWNRRHIGRRHHRIAGILMMLFWSLWIGLIVVLIGLIAFGGFVRGRWY
jgi:hypothetical protein